MSKVSFTNIGRHDSDDMPDEFEFCNADQCIRHVYIDDQFNIDSFTKCLKPENCSECDRYKNRLYMKRSLRMS